MTPDLDTLNRTEMRCEQQFSVTVFVVRLECFASHQLPVCVSQEGLLRPSSFLIPLHLHQEIEILYHSHGELKR